MMRRVECMRGGIAVRGAPVEVAEAVRRVDGKSKILIVQGRGHHGGFESPMIMQGAGSSPSDRTSEPGAADRRAKLRSRGEQKRW